MNIDYESLQFVLENLFNAPKPSSFCYEPFKQQLQIIPIDILESNDFQKLNDQELEEVAQQILFKNHHLSVEPNHIFYDTWIRPIIDIVGLNGLEERQMDYWDKLS